MTVVWFDLESTSVDPMRCTILEVAALATDDQLREIGTPFHALVRPTLPVDVVRSMCEPVVQEMHDESGLWADLAKVKNDPVDVLAMQLHSWLLGLYGWAEPLTLAGCGVGHFDHQVLSFQLPASAALLTYYDYDVSVVRRFLHDICGRTDVDVPPRKMHRAVPDVMDGLTLARYLKEVFGALPAPAQAGVDPLRG
jgi:oligoribonuclease